MAENKDKKPAARGEDAAQHMAEQEATARQERIDRAAREISGADAPETRDALVGGIAVTVPTEPPEGIVAEAAGAMIEQSSRMMAGHPTEAILSPEQMERQRRAAERRADAPSRVQGDPLEALRRAIIETQQGEPLTLDDIPAPLPGQTERGWDPEVTARHPLFLAAMVEELEGAEGGKQNGPLGASGEVSKEHYIDPSDPVALAAAQRELAFHDSRMTNIIQRAIRIGSDRLAAAQAAGGAGYPQAMAVRDVLEGIRKDAVNAGHEI